MEGKEKTVSVMRASADLKRGHLRGRFLLPLFGYSLFHLRFVSPEANQFFRLTPFERIAILGQHRGRNTRS